MRESLALSYGHSCRRVVLTQMPTARTTWTSHFVTDDAKCITFLDCQKFKFCKEIQSQLTVSFVRHYIMPLYKKLQHHWLNPFTCHLLGPKPAVLLPFVKKNFPLSEKNALVMLYDMKIHFVYKGHCSAQSCKNGRDNCRSAQNKTVQ